jgi:hypothetical protein
MNKSFTISDNSTMIKLDIKSKESKDSKDFKESDNLFFNNEEYKECSKCKKYLLILNFRKPLNKQCISCSEGSSIHYRQLKSLASKSKIYIQKILMLETENDRLKNTIKDLLKIKEEREFTISLQKVNIEMLMTENEMLKKHFPQ